MGKPDGDELVLDDGGRSSGRGRDSGGFGASRHGLLHRVVLELEAVLGVAVDLPRTGWNGGERRRWRSSMVLHLISVLICCFPEEFHAHSPLMRLWKGKSWI